MEHAFAIRTYWALTVVSFVSFGWALWVLGHEYPVDAWYTFSPFALHVVSQGILMIWCLRDISQRTFANSSTTLNWAGAIVFLGVVGTTAYAVSVKRRQWKPR